MSVEQEKLVVVSLKPGDVRRRRLRIAAIVILTVAVSLSAGYGAANLRTDLLLAEIADRQLANDKLQVRFDELQQQSMEYKVSADVDQLAVQKIRQDVYELEKVIDDQRQELIFYRGMMSPQDIEKGLSLRSWQIEPASMDRGFEFKLVVQQLASVHRLLSGTVNIIIRGEQAGRAKQFSISELSPQIDKNPVKLRFKYFQSIEGELELPEGFIPTEVVVSARSTGKKRMVAEAVFPWQEAPEAANSETMQSTGE